MTYTHEALAAAWLRWTGRPVTADNLAGVMAVRSYSALVLMLARRNALPSVDAQEAA